jgi:signal transduction histidine kinase
VSEETPVEILLVDDESRNLDALEAVLDDQGYRLIRADDADVALRLLLEHDVAAMILDIKMPKMSGIELAQIIKGSKRFRQIPILFLTAHLLDDKDIIVGYGAGAVDYLTKPFNPTILRHKIAVFADLFRKTRALADLNDRLEQRVAERTVELERSEKALRAAARQKDEFLATLAHELRNPLAPLRTGVDLLMQMPAPAPGITRTLAAMNRQLDHLVRLIDDLLDVSRISRGVLEIKKERVDLSALVRNTSDTFRPLFEQRQVELMVTTRPVTAMVDPTRVAQILGNLLHNGAKFTPAGGAVRVALDHDHGTAVITVTDTGIGIAADQLARIFEMFTRIERVTDTPDRGAGIGLALAQRLAQLHGGDLTATSSGESRGATFTIRLPGAEVPAVPVEPSNGSETGLIRKRAKMTPLDILVIEDNEDVAETLVVWLESGGHHVSVANTGPKGLELVLKEKPQVVLCDVGLPEMDGIEVCQQVRRQAGPDFRPMMIALTGWGMDEDRQRTKEAGFDHHLVKPVAIDLLSELLRSAAPQVKPVS